MFSVFNVNIHPIKNVIELKLFDQIISKISEVNPNTHLLQRISSERETWQKHYFFILFREYDELIEYTLIVCFIFSHLFTNRSERTLTLNVE